jgi:hypothetical protein
MVEVNEAEEREQSTPIGLRSGPRWLPLQKKEMASGALALQLREGDFGGHRPPLQKKERWQAERLPYNWRKGTRLEEGPVDHDHD